MAPSGESFRNTFFFLRMVQSFYRGHLQNTTNNVTGAQEDHDRSRYAAYLNYINDIGIQSATHRSSLRMTHYSTGTSLVQGSNAAGRPCHGVGRCDSTTTYVTYSGHELSGNSNTTYTVQTPRH